MRSLVRLLLVLILLATTAFAQDDGGFQKTFDAGIAAINGGKLDEGIAAFKKCLELRPENPVCAYNVACGYSKKGEKDPAFEWLDKSADWGFGNLDDAKGKSNVDFAPTDTDLTPLHDDPRWAKFMEKIAAGRKALREFTATAAVYVPKSLEGAAEFPLLVVLHDMGKTKNTIVEGRWKNIADELGCALVAPSGRFPIKPIDPSAGMAWFSSPSAYAAGFRSDERPVSEAVADFQKTHKLAADRVYIAGEGMGATVAFNIAVAKSSLYKAVLVIDGVLQGNLAAPRISSAVKAGLRVHAILNRTALSAALGGKDPQPLVDNITKSLGGWALVHKVEAFDLKEGESDPTEAMALAALKSFQVPAAAPVEAGTEK